MRPSWDSLWLEVAQTIAKRSLCARAKVGAVIADSQNRIVATGYNGPPAGFQHRDLECTDWCPRAMEAPRTQNGEPAYFPDYSNCPSLHAEANALLAADRSSWQGGTIYVTGHVCSDCGKLIANSGLSRVVVFDDGANRSYRKYEETYDRLLNLGITTEVQNHDVR